MKSKGISLINIRCRFNKGNVEYLKWGSCTYFIDQIVYRNGLIKTNNISETVEVNNYFNLPDFIIYLDDVYGLTLENYLKIVLNKSISDTLMISDEYLNGVITDYLSIRSHTLSLIIPTPAISTDGNYISDYISGTKFYKRDTVQYLFDNYGITPKEYYSYSIVKQWIYHPKCDHPLCFGYKPFINFSQGFRDHCNNSCHISHRNLMSWKSPKYRKLMSEYTKNSINSIIGKINSQYKAFISHGSSTDNCKLYLGYSRSENILKFGVTSTSLFNRAYRNKLDSIHLITNGTRLQVAEYERLIKLKLFQDNEWVPYDRLHELINIIKISLTN